MSARQSDLLDRQLGIAEQLARRPHASFMEIVCKGFSRVLLEKSAKVRGAQINVLGDRGEGKILI